MECNRNRQHRDVRSHSQSYVLVWVWVKFVVVKWHNSLVWCTYMGSTHTDRNMVVLTLVRALRIHQIRVSRDTKRKINKLAEKKMQLITL